MREQQRRRRIAPLVINVCNFSKGGSERRAVDRRTRDDVPRVGHGLHG